MANNRGLTSEQTSNLILKAIELWANKNTAFQQTIISNNQTGGITAGIVVIPEDKDIPIANNYTFRDTLINNRKALALSPLQGSWINPFIAYPSDEDSIVKGDLSNLMGVQMRGAGTLDGTLKGEKIQLIYKNVQFNCTSSTLCYFFYSEPPSILLFGDLQNKEKQYFVFRK